MGILVVDISWFQTWYQTWYQHFSTFSKPDLLNTTQEQHSSAPRLNTHHGPCGQDPPVPRVRQSSKSSERRRSRWFFFFQLSKWPLSRLKHPAGWTLDFDIFSHVFQKHDMMWNMIKLGEAGFPAGRQWHASRISYCRRWIPWRSQSLMSQLQDGSITHPQPGQQMILVASWWASKPYMGKGKIGF